VVHNWLSGRLVVGARNLVLLVLVFAPLVCLRVCEIRHALAQHAHADVLCDADAVPSENAFLHDVQQLLHALTEFVPAAALLAFASTIAAHPDAAGTVLREPPHRVLPHPPRLRFA
jgi:hypothetical protein